ncbi:MAG: acyl-CoA dehydratase activase-related protein [bacterium]
MPKALLYYNYHTVYETFFNEIGAEIVLSDPTHLVLKKGARLVPDEVCLPIKNYFGHIIDLKEKNVDFIFLPRFMSVEKGATFCPKIIGLPDLVKNIIPGLPPLIELNINLSKKLMLYNNIIKIGRTFNAGIFKSLNAWRAALKKYWIPAFAGMTEKFTGVTRNQLNIAVVGHPYNIYDSNLNLNLIDKLKERGAAIWTPDMVPRETILKEADELPKKIFWTLSRDIVGASKYFIKEQNIHGIINIASFSCGPDSIMGELISYLVREYNKKPYLLLVLDEHAGSAGLETRLEAFIEMIKMNGREISDHSS